MAGYSPERRALLPALLAGHRPSVEPFVRFPSFAHLNAVYNNLLQWTPGPRPPRRRPVPAGGGRGVPNPG